MTDRSDAERTREWRAEHPDKVAEHSALSYAAKRERLSTDPAFKEEWNAYQREYRAKRKREDPEYAERVRAKAREQYRRKKEREAAAKAAKVAAAATATPLPEDDGLSPVFIEPKRLTLAELK